MILNKKNNTQKYLLYITLCKYHKFYKFVKLNFIEKIVIISFINSDFFNISNKALQQILLKYINIKIFYKIGNEN